MALIKDNLTAGEFKAKYQYIDYYNLRYLFGVYKKKESYLKQLIASCQLGDTSLYNTAEVFKKLQISDTTYLINDAIKIPQDAVVLKTPLLSGYKVAQITRVPYHKLRLNSGVSEAIGKYLINRCITNTRRDYGTALLTEFFGIDKVALASKGVKNYE